jgi:hypothetical protein
MKLSESDSSLCSLCRATELRLAGAGEVTDLVLSVVLLPDFDSLPEAQLSSAYRFTPAAYQRRERRIILHQGLFAALSSDVQQAALVHEIAHATLHGRPVVLIDPIYRIPLSEEIVADLLACRWGFLSELRQERIVSIGARYCEILELWPREEEFIHEMTIWHQTRLSGVAGQRQPNPRHLSRIFTSDLRNR